MTKTILSTGLSKEECKPCDFHVVQLIYSGGGDTHPLPVCKNCGWIVIENK